MQCEECIQLCPSAPLGRSDHNLVHLLPAYKPRVQQQPASTKVQRRWSTEADQALMDCFETTDWETLRRPHGDNIESLTHCITDYIHFCVDIAVPSKRVQCFSNNKPWVTPELKNLLNLKKRAFKSGYKEELKRVQTKLKGEGLLQEEDGGETSIE